MKRFVFVKVIEVQHTGPKDHSSHHLQHAADKLLIFNLHPPSLLLPFLVSLPPLTDAARSETQKGAACFSNLGTVVML